MKLQLLFSLSKNPIPCYQRGDYDMGIPDPLSPYSGFLVLLQRAEKGLIQGSSHLPGCTSVSHLLFTDDSLILCCADGGDALQLQSMF